MLCYSKQILTNKGNFLISNAILIQPEIIWIILRAYYQCMYFSSSKYYCLGFHTKTHEMLQEIWCYIYSPAGSAVPSSWDVVNIIMIS